MTTVLPADKFKRVGSAECRVGNIDNNLSVLSLDKLTTLGNDGSCHSLLDHTEGIVIPTREVNGDVAILYGFPLSINLRGCDRYDEQHIVTPDVCKYFVLFHIYCVFR